MRDAFRSGLPTFIGGVPWSLARHLPRLATSIGRCDSDVAVSLDRLAVASLSSRFSVQLLLSSSASRRRIARRRD